MYRTMFDLIEALEERNLLAYDVRALRELSKATAQLNNQIRKIHEYSKNRFAPSNVGYGADIQRLMDIVSRFRSNGWIKNVADTKAALQSFLDWYENNGSEYGVYSPSLVADVEAYIAGNYDRITTGRIVYGIKVNGSSYITLRQVQVLSDVIKITKQVMKSYNRLIIDGKKKTITEFFDENNYDQATQFRYDNRNKSAKDNPLKKFGINYVMQVSKGDNVAHMIDGTIGDEKGVVGRLVDFVRQAVVKRSKIRNTLLKPYNEFKTANKKYFRDLDKQTFKIVDSDGKEYLITRNQALYLYMLNMREQGKSHINVDYNPKAKGVEFYSESDIQLFDKPLKFNDNTFAQMENEFTDTDRAYMEVVRKLLDEGGKLKEQTDFERLGYTNANEENYIPIVNDKYNADKRYAANTNNTIDNMFNLSFNMDIKKNANTVVMAANLDHLVGRYATQIANYSGALVIIENNTKILNYRAKSGATIRKMLNGIMPTFDKWYEKMVNDAFQITAKSSADNAFAKIRSMMVRASLGLNIKVWTTQFSSYPLAFNRLSTKSIIYGLKGSKAMFKKSTNFMSEIEQYAPVTYDRSTTNTVVIGESNAQYVFATAMDWTTAPIGHNDAVTIYMLWNACLKEVSSKYNIDINSEECKIKAGELLDLVVEETQPMYDAVDAPPIKRSDSEAIKTLMMFKTQPFQMLNMFISSVNDIINYRARSNWFKNNPTAIVDKYGTNRTDMDNIKKQVASKMARTTSGFIASSLMYAFIASLFRHLLGKNKDDEEFMETMLDSSLASVLSIDPIISVIYTKMIEGYDINTSSLSTLNDTLTSVRNLATNPTRNSITNFVKNISTFLGIPTKNLLDYVQGLLNVLSPELAYKYKNVFYNQDYGTDKKVLSKAISQNRSGLQDASIENYLRKKGITNVTPNTLNTIKSLTKNDIDYISKISSSKLEDEIKLADESSYTPNSQAIKQYETMVTNNYNSVVSNKYFNSFDDDTKAKALKRTTEVTKHYVVASKSNKVTTNKFANISFNFGIDPTELVCYYYYLKNLKDKNSRLNDINKSKYTSKQKLAIKKLLGYKLTEEELNSLTTNKLLQQYI